MSVSIQIDKGSKKPLYLQLYEDIKQKILSGEINYMQRLPSVRNLCKMLNVNLSTVTKALSKLENEGYIKATPGSGYYVVYSEYQDKIIFEEESLIDAEGYINLASSKLPYSLYPIEWFKDSLNCAIEKYSPQIFDYIEHFKNPLKEYLVETYLKKLGIVTSPQELTVVSGAQQGIEITTKSFLKPGDTIFLENPSYLGAYHIFSNMHLNIVGIDIDQMQNIEDYIKKFSPKAIYIIPFSQNPTGVSYSKEYKEYLCEISQKYDFYIIEDDFLSDIGVDEEILPIKAYDKYDRVFYIKSFSTVTMPALRIGFVLAPRHFSEEVAYYKSMADISTSLLIQVSFYYFLKNFFNKHIENLKTYINQRQKLFLRLAKDLQIDNRLFTQNVQGIFVSFYLPPTVSSATIYNKLKTQRVLVQPHTCFYHKPASTNFFRISFLDCTEDELQIAMQKIQNVLNSAYQKEEV